MSGLYRYICFFQLWCEACSFSKICFDENQHFCVFFDHIVIFLDFCRRMVHTRARKLTNGDEWSIREPVNSHIWPFGEVLDNVGPKQPTLKLKPEESQGFKCIYWGPFFSIFLLFFFVEASVISHGMYTITCWNVLIETE